MKYAQIIALSTLVLVDEAKTYELQSTNNQNESDIDLQAIEFNRSGEETFNERFLDNINLASDNNEKENSSGGNLASTILGFILGIVIVPCFKACILPCFMHCITYAYERCNRNNEVTEEDYDFEGGRGTMGNYENPDNYYQQI
jgi:hypothetical protein